MKKQTINMIKTLEEKINTVKDKINIIKKRIHRGNASLNEANNIQPKKKYELKIKKL